MDRGTLGKHLANASDHAEEAMRLLAQGDDAGALSAALDASDAAQNAVNLLEGVASSLELAGHPPVLPGHDDPLPEVGYDRPAAPAGGTVSP